MYCRHKLYRSDHIEYESSGAETGSNGGEEGKKSGIRNVTVNVALNSFLKITLVQIG